MARTKVLAMVLAGGQGGRMEVLTQRRAKPAMPFAGVYRLIDMSLSNLRNSGISDVWVVVQYETQSINDALANGRPWDLDRTHGGLRIIPPQQEADEDGGWHEGNADALYRNKDLIRAFDPDVLLVLSADHVYRLDYNDVIERHLANDADVTIVTTKVPKDQASNHAVIEVDGGVSGFAYKPEEPASDIVATEVFAYNPDAVLETLDRLVAELDDDGDGTGLEDFGHHLLPALVERGNVRDFRLPGYWKDVGRPETYFEAHMDLLAEHPDLALDDPAWPIFTLDHQRLPARLHEGARVRDALISPGCQIHGTVERSVLAPGVVVEAGATVSSAIVLQDTVIKADATVRFAIVDRKVTIGKGASVGDEPEGELPTTEELVLIGQGATVCGGSTLKRGARVDPE
jgi:glucose-1-phosphate adenylyltransferase